MTTLVPSEKENLEPVTSTNTNKEEQKEISVKPQTKEQKADLIVVGADVGKGKLQKRFEKFRTLRIQQVKVQKQLNVLSKLDRSSPQFREQLRNKFIETAKKYIGVPYAKKFHKPGSPLRKSRLFLDCCALIRQVVYDLREDFGFILQRYNQSYQYDVLPGELKFEELRPGDLIFYSGRYLDKRCMRQKHDIVHVEIFIGGETGEESIGSRWFNGVVSHFKSFKFKSTMYDNVVHHFKSLDPWLQGICKSYCTEHKWDDNNTNWCHSKHSVFSEDSYEGEADPDIEGVAETEPTL